MHVLALDSSEHQLEGSERRAPRAQTLSNLTSRAFWLGERPSFESHPGSRGASSSRSDSLQIEHVLEEWLESMDAFGSIPDGSSLPVVFVALHACGSLTPEILRKVSEFQPSADRRWHVAGALIVGCCYNLLLREDGQ